MRIRQRVGIGIVVSSIVLFLSDRFLGSGISSGIARLICGDAYLQSIDGIMPEASCGFDADMYFVVAIVMIGGIGAFIGSRTA